MSTGAIAIKDPQLQLLASHQAVRLDTKTATSDIHKAIKGDL